MATYSKHKSYAIHFQVNVLWLCLLLPVACHTSYPMADHMHQTSTARTYERSRLCTSLKYVTRLGLFAMLKGIEVQGDPNFNTNTWDDECFTAASPYITWSDCASTCTDYTEGLLVTVFPDYSDYDYDCDKLCPFLADTSSFGSFNACDDACTDAEGSTWINLFLDALAASDATTWGLFMTCGGYNCCDNRGCYTYCAGAFGYQTAAPSISPTKRPTDSPTNLAEYLEENPGAVIISTYGILALCCILPLAYCNTRPGTYKQQALNGWQQTRKSLAVCSDYCCKCVNCFKGFGKCCFGATAALIGCVCLRCRCKRGKKEDTNAKASIELPRGGNFVSTENQPRTDTL